MTVRQKKKKDNRGDLRKCVYLRPSMVPFVLMAERD